MTWNEVFVKSEFKYFPSYLQYYKRRLSEINVL